MAESPRLIAGLHDVAMMSNSIQQRGGHLRVGEDAAPFAEAQVRRDHYAGVLIELGEQVKQKRATDLAEWQVAQLIEDHQVDV